jgi:hypothetical protein
MPMSPRLLRPRATGFNPKSIAGLQLWLDGSDSSTMTMNGTTVSEWRSKSGSIALTQSTASEQPTLSASYYLGRSALTFDGGDVMYAAAASLAVAPSTSFLVVDEASAVNFGGMLVGSPSSGDDFAAGGSRFLTAVHDGVSNAFVRRAVDPNASSSNALIADSPNIGGTAFGKKLFSVVSLSSTAFMRSNGVAGSTDAAHTASGSSVGTLVGGRFLSGVVSASFRFNGKICEVLHYSSALTSLQVSDVEKWLAGRWGITLS